MPNTSFRGKVAAAAVSIVAFSVPAALHAQASRSMTGVSRPDPTPIVNTPESQEPMAVTPSAAPVATLKPHPGTPYATQSEVAPARTFTVVGPAVPLDPVRDAVHPAVSSETNADADIVTRLPGPSNQLPSGTIIHTRLAQSIATESTANSTPFSAEITEPVERDGHVLLPPGSTITGFVTDIHGGKRISGPASIHLRTVAVTLPDGTKYALRGQVIDTNRYKELKVDDEGTIMGKDHAGKTGSVMALSAGSGAAAGAMIAGVPGALIGAGIGAGVSTAVWLKQDRQATLPSETTIVFSLTEPLTVGQN